MAAAADVASTICTFAPLDAHAVWPDCESTSAHVLPSLEEAITQLMGLCTIHVDGRGANVYAVSWMVEGSCNCTHSPLYAVPLTTVLSAPTYAPPDPV
ncbi:hypothetical protein [Silvimonas sp.]|uniref:hypothetical protein n=1 Tax=Silvimonas sp. TaxID=2650811 RepID=UPI00284165EE|nr:hypothetical protein [Silvimonas sp.]MDR3428845.1 hypothetical protein [Silvimonas sp.]